MYMVEKSGKLLCRIVLIMLLFVLCFLCILWFIKRQDMHWIWQKNECGMNRILL